MHAHREDVLQRPRRRRPRGRTRRRGRAPPAPRPPAPIAAHVGELALHLLLQPGVERHARGQLDPQPVDVRGRRMAEPLGPAAPPAPKRSAMRAEDRELPHVVRQRRGARAGPRRATAARRPTASRPTPGRARCGRRRCPAPARRPRRGWRRPPAVELEVGDPQRQRRREPPARRRVGRRLHRRHGRDGVQRVEQHGRGAVLAPGPADELPQVAEVADAPRALRVQRVELQHPAPRPRPSPAARPVRRRR